ncbi:hypothetical protein DL770_000703 [Monosporascus sp. CRB-9-2]|nr:hypothetical protein DL770_000703 [Monosporascus sp. CRB-9-2]
MNPNVYPAGPRAPRPAAGNGHAIFPASAGNCTAQWRASGGVPSDQVHTYTTMAAETNNDGDDDNDEDWASWSLEVLRGVSPVETVNLIFTLTQHADMLRGYWEFFIGAAHTSRRTSTRTVLTMRKELALGARGMGRTPILSTLQRRKPPASVV